MPLELPGRLAHRLRRMVHRGEPSGPHHAKVLAVASSKGGVGKTTSAVNLAMWYAAMGQPTLILDLDPQAHIDAALNLGGPLGDGQQATTAGGAGEATLGGVLLGRRRDIMEVARPTRWPDLCAVSSHRDLAEVEMVLAAKIGKEMILKEALRVARSHFAFIIIDCPPNLGTLTLNALCAADALVIPADMSMLAFEGVVDIMQAVETLRGRLGQALEVCGIFCTRWDRRQSQINHAVRTCLTDAFGDLVMQTRIPQLAAINRAHLRGEPLLEMEPRSPASLAYRELACEIGRRLDLGLGEPAAEATGAGAGAAEGGAPDQPV